MRKEGAGNYGVGPLLHIDGVKMPGKGIELSIFQPWTVRDGKTKLGREERPPGLARVEPLGPLNVRQVFIGLSKQLRDAWRPPTNASISPVQVPLDCQQLTVPHIVVSSTSVKRMHKDVMLCYPQGCYVMLSIGNR